jgi:hypothetical protein
MQSPGVFLNKSKKEKPQKNGLLPAAIAVILLLVSCASRHIDSENRPYAYLTDGSKFFLLPPGGTEKSMDMAQHISASYGGQDYFFNAWVKADEAGMEMTLFNELGVNMGELSYRDGAVNISSPIFPKSLRPEYIVADFQLCFYKPLLLRRALKDCGLLFETEGSIRRVLKGKKTITEIEKTGASVKLANRLRGYVYTLEGDFE